MCENRSTTVAATATSHTCTTTHDIHRSMAWAEYFETGGPVVTVHDSTKPPKRARRSVPLANLESITASKVHSLAFTADSTHLLIQCGPPDWVLLCVGWERSKLVAVAKQVVPNGTWLQGTSGHPEDPAVVLAAGDGCLRMWRIVDDIMKPLVVNLKSEPKHYTAHAWLPGDMIVFGTASGSVLIFEGTEFKKALEPPASHADAAIGSIVPFSKGFVVGADGGRVRIYEKSDDARMYYKLTAEFSVAGDSSSVLHVATSSSDSNLIVVLSSGQVYEFKLANYELYKSDDIVFRPLITNFHARGAEGDASVISVAACIRKPMFVTTGADNTVRLWNYSQYLGPASNLPPDTVPTLELVKRFRETPMATALHPSGLLVVVGFESTLQLMNILMDDIKPIKDFAMRGVTSVAFSHGGQFFAAANSATLSIMETYTGSVLRTLRGHSDRISSLAWSADDRTLVSSGRDGIIYRWDVASGKPRATVDMSARAATSLSMCGQAGAQVWALTETTRRRGGGHAQRLQLLNLQGPQSSGNATSGTGTSQKIKALGLSVEDAEIWGCDVPSTLSSVVAVPSGRALVTCAASGAMPAAMQVYSPPPASGALLDQPKRPAFDAASSVARSAAEHGGAELAKPVPAVELGPPHQALVAHSASITCATLTWDEGLLITGCADGTVMLHFLLPAEVVEQALDARTAVEMALSGTGDNTVALSGPGALAPAPGAGLPFAEETLVTTAALEGSRLRKVKLESTVGDLKLQNEYNIAYKQMAQEEKMKGVESKFQAELQVERDRHESLVDEKRAMQVKFESQIGSMEHQHQRELADIDESYKEKIDTEISRYNKLATQRVEQESEWEADLVALHARQEEAVAVLRREYEAAIEAEEDTQTRLNVERAELRAGITAKTDALEDDADAEMDRLRVMYESRLAGEKKTALMLMADNSALKEKYEKLEEKKVALRHRVADMAAREKELFDHITSLQKDVTGHKKEIREREETLNEKDSRIYDLRRKNQELEKFKFVLNYKIQELKRQILPRKREISDMRDQMKEMELELLQYHKSNAALLLMISELKLKRNGAQGDLDKVEAALAAREDSLRTVRTDLLAVKQAATDIAALQARVTALYHKYVHGDPTAVLATQTEDAADMQRDIGRQRAYLEKNVDSLKRKLAKDTALFRKDRQRLMRENTMLTKEINDLRRQIHFIAVGNKSAEAQLDAELGLAKTGRQLAGLTRTAARKGVFGDGLDSADRATRTMKSKVAAAEASKAAAAASAAAAAPPPSPAPGATRPSSVTSARRLRSAGAAGMGGLSSTGPLASLGTEQQRQLETDLAHASDDLAALRERVLALREAVAADPELGAHISMPAADDDARALETALLQCSVDALKQAATEAAGTWGQTSASLSKSAGPARLPMLSRAGSSTAAGWGK